MPTVTFARLMQPLKALLPIDVTKPGITTLVKPRHSSNAALPMLVTELPIERLARPPQYLNAQLPMTLTLLGMVTPVKL